LKLSFEINNLLFLSFQFYISELFKLLMHDIDVYVLK